MGWFDQVMPDFSDPNSMGAWGALGNVLMQGAIQRPGKVGKAGNALAMLAGAGMQGAQQGADFAQNYAQKDITNKFLPAALSSGVQGKQLENLLKSYGLPAAQVDAILQGKLLTSLGGQPDTATGMPGALAPALISRSMMDIRNDREPGGVGPGNQMPAEGQPTPQEALEQYRQQNGMQTPPVDLQRAGMGLPVGVGTPAPGAQPPVGGAPPGVQPGLPTPPTPGGAQDQLAALIAAQRAQQSGGAGAVPPSPGAALPAGAAGPQGPQGPAAPGMAPGALPGGMKPETMAMLLNPRLSGIGQLQPDYVNAVGAAQAAIEHAKTAGGKQAEIEAAGPLKTAGEHATNVEAADKAVSSVIGRLPNAFGIIDNMKGVADNVPYGYAVQHQRDFLNQLKSPKAADYDSFNKWNENLFTQELPAIVQNSGGRIDIPLVKAIQAASQVPLDAQPQEKQKLLDQTKDLLGKVRDNALQTYKAETGRDFDLSRAFSTKEDVGSALKSGVITRLQAKKILSDHPEYLQ